MCAVDVSGNVSETLHDDSRRGHQEIQAAAWARLGGGAPKTHITMLSFHPVSMSVLCHSTQHCATPPTSSTVWHNSTQLTTVCDVVIKKYKQPRGRDWEARSFKLSVGGTCPSDILQIEGLFTQGV
jgi:hypothetical protein